MTNQLASIKDFKQLIPYLEEELDWPCQKYGFDEITFKYTPEELGIKDEDSVQIKQIRQLRPFYQGQPWGIFFIEFEKKRLPVALLRRVLSHLVVKKRASANSADKAVWNMDNLLFISAFGDESTDNREIAFAHFHQEVGDLPTLKVLGWDGADTVLKMEFVDQELREKLHWPKDPKNVEAWQSSWSSAFRHKPGFVIKTANALADRLAELARGIRGAAETLMAHETEKGPLRQLYKAFQTALIHDLTEANFADTYAQTITYGLLTAAISRTDMSGGIYGTALVASNVTDLVPITNPFLKEMLDTFIHAGDHKGGIQFDELGIQDVVELLRGEETDLPAVLRDFNNKTPGEDPVIQFYEHFLSAYNKKLKIQRGVFYTPKPIVSYIVRSVHELLKTEFGLEDGLADTTTWGEMEKKIPGLQRPVNTNPESPFVMILDPATGTATFLVEVIEIIFKTLTDKWEKQHINKTAQITAWNEYVPKHLLPRLFGFELMMAPYAIAHMKVGLKLFETGYNFCSMERVRVFLTNSLEPASNEKIQHEFSQTSPALAHEARAVNEVKNIEIFSVVIGNPPYSGHSFNLTSFARAMIEPYKFINNRKIVEKGALQLEKNLNDDYVKFIRFAQLICSAKPAILGFITNHSFLENPTLRGLRWSILQDFSLLQFIDLGGNIARRDKGIDENVFDIEQGVAISLMTNPFNKNQNKTKIFRVKGTREEKYQFLNTNNSSTTAFSETDPIEPFYLFRTENLDVRSEYQKGISITDIFPLNSTGVKTHRDEFCIDFDKEPLKKRIEELISTTYSNNDLQKLYGIHDTYGWKLEKCRRKIREDKGWEGYFTKILYRPFDLRNIYFSPLLIELPRTEVSQHFINTEKNLGIIFMRQVASDEPYSHFFVTRLPVDNRSFYSNRGTMSFAPLYLNWEKNYGSLFSSLKTQVEPNIAAECVLSFERLLGCQKIEPEEIFNYMYAVFYSNAFRSRYADFLKIDFPRLQLTSNLELFRALCKLGSQLVALHLFEVPDQNNQITFFTGEGNNLVQSGYPKYEKSKVFINSNQGFERVSQDIWDFQIGGYQVCHKWLKDRRSRQLSEDDIIHYQRIITALTETIRIMGEIDQVIEEHGGWPIK